MSDRLERLLRPRSIAVIGGGAWCDAVIEQNLKLGFDGEIWPVHPTKQTVGGVETFPDIGSIPGAPDAAFVGVNRHATIDVVRALHDQGAGGAVCFASGFRESADGIELQAKLLNAAGNMTVLGPNCYGFVNYLDGALLWPDQHGGVAVETGVAIVTQSSNIAINITMQRRGLPLAYAVTVGNQAQTGLAEVGAALLHDDRVTALGLHIEGIDDLRAFERLADIAHARGKPVVALKVGVSEGARDAALTHTAALTGTNAGAEALFERLAFAQVDTLAQFVETLKLLHVTGPISGNNIASMSCSGGEAGLIADIGERYGLAFPPLSEPQSMHLRTILGPLVSPANPLDYHTQIWRDREALTKTFSSMMTPSLALSLVILDFPREDRCHAKDWDPAVEACLAAKERTGENLAVVSTLSENMPEAVSKRLIDGGVVPLCGLEDACAAVKYAAAVGRYGAPEPILSGTAPSSTVTLSEAQAKAELERFNIQVPRSSVSPTVEAAALAADTIGFPIVLKGEGFAHKSENGAVHLNLTSADMVRSAAVAMRAEGFLVEEMITDTVAELLVGIVCDEAHGFVLTLAAGGVLTELLMDRQSLLLPASRAMIETALEKLRIAPMLDGYRGKPAANRRAIIDTVLALQDYVADNADTLHAVEINPLLCGPLHAIAADALITRKADHD
jgi:acyl-CoA synthetase (NDP forming)